MNERAPLPDVRDAPDRGRVLVFSPHADDDVLGCGGTSALHVRQGDPVRVIVVYDGVAGDPEGRYEREELREIRRREALAGGARLGLEDYLFWDYPEGHEPGPGELAAGAARVAEALREFAPEVVYAPWIGEFHLDHHVLARVVRAGLALAEFAGVAWGYEVWTPLVATRIVDITPVAQDKIEALQRHRSQIEYGDVVHYGLGLSAQRCVYLPPGSTYGEAFAPLGEAADADRELVGLEP